MRLVLAPLFLSIMLVCPAVADDSVTMKLKALQDQIDKLRTLVEAQQKTIGDQESHIGALMHYLPLAFGVDKR